MLSLSDNPLSSFLCDFKVKESIFPKVAVFRSGTLHINCEVRTISNYKLYSSFLYIHVFDIVHLVYLINECIDPKCTNWATLKLLISTFVFRDFQRADQT
jgi:hypothetical protein